MKSKIGIIYSIFSAIVFLCVIAYLCVSVSNIRTQNINNSFTAFNKLQEIVQNSYLVKGNFNSDFFKKNIKIFFQKSSNIKTIAIYSKDNKLSYVYTKSSLVRDKLKTGMLENSPEYLLNSNNFRETSFTRKFTIPNQDAYTIISSFTVLKRAELVNLLNRTLIIIFAYIIITGLVIFLYYVLKDQQPSVVRQPVSSPSPKKPDIIMNNNENHYESEFDKAISTEDDIDKTIIQVQEDIPADDYSDNSNIEESRKGLFSPVSGLCWEDLLEERLNFELERSASFDQDLSFIVLKAAYIQKHSREYLKISKKARDTFPFQDLLFEFGEDMFAIILPDTDIDQAIIKAESFKKDLKNMDSGLSIFCGISSRNGRLIDNTILLTETTAALNKATTESNTSIIAFRSNPVKYREFLSGKN